MVRFVVATVDNFTAKDIDVTQERKSVDGTKAIKHTELLSTDELNAIRADENFQFYGDDSEVNNIDSLMETQEWKAVEETP